MYVVYSICLYFFVDFLFTYNKNHLSKKKHEYSHRYECQFRSTRL